LEVPKTISQSTAINARLAHDAPPGHIPALDGLRGIAILLVMFYHFTATYTRGFSGILYRCFDVGWCGVDLFFVLSGFLITGILFDAKNDPHYFQAFLHETGASDIPAVLRVPIRALRACASSTPAFASHPALYARANLVMVLSHEF
jgi:hypothetical protein